MSIQASISIQNHDGTVDSIKVFHKGDLLGVGDLLLFYYNDETSVRELIEMGDIIILRQNISETQFLHDDSEETLRFHANVDLEDVNNQQYNYLFIDGRWVYDHGELDEAVLDLSSSLV